MKRRNLFMKEAFIWVVALFAVAACSNDKELLDVDSEPTPMRVAKNSLPETRSIEEAKALILFTPYQSLEIFLLTTKTKNFQ